MTSTLAYAFQYNPKSHCAIGDTVFTVQRRAALILVVLRSESGAKVMSSNCQNQNTDTGKINTGISAGDSATAPSTHTGQGTKCVYASSLREASRAGPSKCVAVVYCKSNAKFKSKCISVQQSVLDSKMQLCEVKLVAQVKGLSRINEWPAE